MTEARSELLTTGQAAALLGSSRQHVVDLCDRGMLPCVTTGRHRRIWRSAVERLAFGDPGGRRLTRDQERSLWLHRAVAGKLALDPDGVLAIARANLDQLRDRPGARRSATWFSRWSAVLERGPTAVLDVLTSREELAVELRQNSPFAGVLSEPERRAALAEFQHHNPGVTDRDRAAA